MDHGRLGLEGEQPNVRVLTPQSLEMLSKRERQVLAHGAAGLSDKKICLAMGIALNTLRTYWQRIRAKVGPFSRSALAVAYAEALSKRKSEGTAKSQGDFEIDLTTQTFRRRNEFDFRIYEDGIPIENLRQVLSADDLESLSALVAYVERGRDAQYSFTDHNQVDGKTKIYNVHVKVTRDEDGKAQTIVGNRLPSIELGTPLVADLHVGHWKIHLDTNELRVDDAFRKIYRLETEAKVHLSPDLLLEVHPGEYEMVAETIQSLRSRRRRTARMTHRLMFDDGTTSWITHDMTVVREKVCGTAISLLDVKPFEDE